MRGYCQGQSRTDGSRLNHVADGEPLNGLVLGNAAGTVGAAHRVDVAAAILVTTAKESYQSLDPNLAAGNSRPPFSLSGNAHKSFFVGYSIVVYALIAYVDILHMDGSGYRGTGIG